MMETFEKHGVSFASITQQFNSASSMGRLILNVLLSFAQFERELISERTRDKIAAVRRKGKWSGGKPILGYDVDDRTKLVVNQDEARRVVAIFKLYLEHQALIPTIRELNQCGWKTKTWVTKKGTQVGGHAFDKMKLYRLLTNVTYIGKVSHHGQLYAGEHAGIVPEELFNRAQAVLDRNRQTGGSATRNRYGALLRGLLRCVPCQCSMGHTYSCKNGRKRYRYYVCLAAQKRGWDACPSKSVPASEIERFVLDRIRTIGHDPGLLAETLRQARKQADEQIAELDAEARAVARELARLAKQKDSGVLHERQSAERRQTQIREEKIALERDIVEERDVATAFAAFDPMWAAMTTVEQCRLVQLLVERVDYDGPRGKVTVTFHPSGIKTLAAEVLARKGA